MVVLVRWYLSGVIRAVARSVGWSYLGLATQPRSQALTRSVRASKVLRKVLKKRPKKVLKKSTQNSTRHSAAVSSAYSVCQSQLGWHPLSGFHPQLRFSQHESAKRNQEYQSQVWALRTPFFLLEGVKKGSRQIGPQTGWAPEWGPICLEPLKRSKKAHLKSLRANTDQLSYQWSAYCAGFLETFVKIEVETRKALEVDLPFISGPLAWASFSSELSTVNPSLSRRGSTQCKRLDSTRL